MTYLRARADVLRDLNTSVLSAHFTGMFLPSLAARSTAVMDGFASFAKSFRSIVVSGLVAWLIILISLHLLGLVDVEGRVPP